MAAPLLAWLARRSERADGSRPRLWDGAVGTELIARGLDLEREAPEAWTLGRPEVVREVHRAHVEAGAEVVQTNTFGASRPRLARRGGGLERQFAALQHEAVRLARAAGARFVVASLGPTGLDPLDPDMRARIAEAYREQAAELARAGADALHLETVLHPVEGCAAIAAARQAAPSLPVLASITVALGDHGFQTPLGVPLAAVAKALEAAAPDALGLNCSLEARKLLGAVRALRELTSLPLIVQPQASEPSVGCKGELRGDDPARFARDTLKLADEGVDAVGGCCGATPAHIAALRRALDERYR